VGRTAWSFDLYGSTIRKLIAMDIFNTPGGVQARAAPSHPPPCASGGGGGERIAHRSRRRQQPPAALCRRP